MRKIIACLLFLMPMISISQTRTYSGIVKDIATLQPVQLVSISAEGSNIGAVTNDEGLFRISLPKDAETLQFSHLSYNNFTYELDPAKETLEIFIEPKTFVLDEIVISNTPLDQVLESLIKSSKKRLEKSLLLHTYYRELNQINGNYTTFADGMLDYYVKKANGKSDLLVRQSRAFKIADPEMAGKMQNASAVSFDVKKAISAAYNFNIVDQLANNKNYDYQLRSKVDKNGKSINIIHITPKESVKEDLFEGSVTYDGNSKLILEIDIHKAPSHAQFSEMKNLLILKAKINDLDKKASFRIDGDRYVMIYSRVMLDFYIKVGKQLNDSFKLLSDVYVVDYQEGEFELEKSRRYEKNSLYLAGNNYSEDFWKTNNIILLSQAEEDIIRSLQQ